MKRVYLVSLSGGKDSQASLIYVLNNYPKRKIIAHFCDTHWEHPITYKHIDYLVKKLNVPLQRLENKEFKGFRDICIQKKMFPTGKKRFCTIELKMKPTFDYIKTWLERGYKVVNVVGVRKQESQKRKNQNKYSTAFCGVLPKSKKAAKAYYTKENAFRVFAPIIDWDEAQVYDYNTQNGTKNNPLYKRGFMRVGCYPCVFSNQREISMLDDFGIKRIEKLEKEVSKKASKEVTFFYKDNKPCGIREIKKDSKYQFNTLGLELGCINHLGKCE